MKKYVLTALCVLFTVLGLLTSASCKTQPQDLCYYGYFEKEAFVLLYNGSKNVLYYVSVPVDVINRWARQEGFELFTESFRDFVGLEENGVMLSNYECYKSVIEILDAFSVSDSADFSGDEKKINHMLASDKINKNYLKRIEASSDVEEKSGKTEDTSDGSFAMEDSEASSFLDIQSDIFSGIAEKRLNVISKRCSDFLQPAVFDRIKILCGMDLSLLFTTLSEKNASSVVLNAECVMGGNLSFSRDYFQLWINQIV